MTEPGNADSRPRLDVEREQYEPLNESERKELAKSVRGMLARSGESYVGYRHRNMPITVEMDDVPGWGEQALNIRFRVEGDLDQKIAIKLAGDAASVLDRAMMRGARTVHADNLGDDQGHVRKGDIEYFTELQANPDAFIEIDPDDTRLE